MGSKGHEKHKKKKKKKDKKKERDKDRKHHHHHHKVINNALSFYGSKMILDLHNCFEQVQIVLVGSKTLWSGPNHFGQVQIRFYGPIFIIWTCPKWLVLSQNDLDGPK